MKNTNAQFILFAILIIGMGAFQITTRPKTHDYTKDILSIQQSRDSLLNLMYESEKEIINLENQIKYLEHEIRKDSLIIHGATPKQLIDLTAEFMRRVGQRDSLH